MDNFDEVCAGRLVFYALAPNGRIVDTSDYDSYDLTEVRVWRWADQIQPILQARALESGLCEESWTSWATGDDVADLREALDYQRFDGLVEEMWDVVTAANEAGLVDVYEMGPDAARLLGLELMPEQEAYVPTVTTIMDALMNGAAYHTFSPEPAPRPATLVAQPLHCTVNGQEVTFGLRSSVAAPCTVCLTDPQLHNHFERTDDGAGSGVAVCGDCWSALVLAANAFDAERSIEFYSFGLLPSGAVPKLS